MKKVLTLALVLWATVCAAQPPDIEELEGVVSAVSSQAVTTDDGDMIIETDVTVKVTHRIRGGTATTVTVRVVGGTVGGVTLVNSNETVPLKNKKYHFILHTDSHSKLRPVDGNRGMVVVP